MRNKFEISNDGLIFSISDDGTITRIGKIDNQGNIEDENCNHSRTVDVMCFSLIFIVIISIILGINLSTTSSNLAYYKQKYYILNDMQNSIVNENNRLISENTNLRNQNSNLQKEIINLRPQHYAINTSQAFSYYRCADIFYKKKCYYNKNQTIEIYYQHNGYGLSIGGYVKMSDLRKL